MTVNVGLSKNPIILTLLGGLYGIHWTVVPKEGSHIAAIFSGGTAMHKVSAPSGIRVISGMAGGGVDMGTVDVGGYEPAKFSEQRVREYLKEVTGKDVVTLQYQPSARVMKVTPSS